MLAPDVAKFAWLIVTDARAGTGAATPYVPYVFAIIGVGAGCSVLAAEFLSRWTAIGLGAAIGAIAFLLLADVGKMDVPVVPFMLIGAIANAAFIAYFRFLTRHGRANDPRLRWRHVLLLPRTWPESATAIVSTKELAARLYVAVAAATGGVVGTMMTLPFFWAALAEALAPVHLFVTAVLTMVYLTLIGPLHEYAIGRLQVAEAERQRTHRPQFPQIHALLWPGPRSIIRFVLAWLLVVSLHLCYVSLEQCVSRGEQETIYVMLISGLIPGVSSYYWSAALQLGVASVMRRTTLPAVYRESILGAGLVITRLTMLFDSNGIIWEGISEGWPTYIRAAVVILLCVLTSVVAVGSPIVAGGWALDRFRSRTPMRALTACVVPAFLLGSLTADYLIGTIVQQPISATDIAVVSARSISASLLWMVGLWSSGFPQLVMRHRGRMVHKRA